MQKERGQPNRQTNTDPHQTTLNDTRHPPSETEHHPTLQPAPPCSKWCAQPRYVLDFQILVLLSLPAFASKSHSREGGEGSAGRELFRHIKKTTTSNQHVITSRSIGTRAVSHVVGTMSPSDDSHGASCFVLQRVSRTVIATCF